MTALSEQTYQMRRHLIDRLAPSASARFDYVNADTAIVECPVCSASLTLAFHGTAPEADLRCQRGCAERAILGAIERRRPG